MWPTSRYSRSAASAMAAVGARCSRSRSFSCRLRFVGIVPLIQMVIFCAVGGRQSCRWRRGGNAHRQLGQDGVFRVVPGIAVVRDGRAVHRGRVVFPRGLAGLVPISSSRDWEARGRRPPRPAQPGAGGMTSETASWPNSTDFLLALENVSVSFDGFKAVNELNLYVDKGELRVIIGPNVRPARPTSRYST